MAYLITLVATPSSYNYTAPATVALQATVTNADNNAPVVGTTVTFRAIPSVFEGAATTTVQTIAGGIATQPFNYPIPGIIEVTASVTDDGVTTDASVTVVSYSPALTPVTVTNAYGNIIDQYAINAGIQAIIPATLELFEGQLFTFHWGNQRRQRAAELNNQGQIVGLPWVVNVKTQFAPATVLADGVYTVFYTVNDSNGNDSPSQPKQITVQGSNVNPATLLPPELLPAALSNKINLADWYAGVSIKIPPQPRLATTGTYSITLATTPRAASGGYPRTIAIATNLAIPAGAANNGIEMEIPYNNGNGLLAGLNNVDGDFFYVIKPQAGPELASESLRVLIDTVPPTL